MRHYGIVRLQLLKACVILLFKFNHHATATSSFCNFATIWAPTANAKRLSDYVPIYYSYCCCHLLSERFATFYYYCYCWWHLLAKLFAIFITLTTAAVHGTSCPSDLTLYCLILLLLLLLTTPMSRVICHSILLLPLLLLLLFIMVPLARVIWHYIVQY